MYSLVVFSIKTMWNYLPIKKACEWSAAEAYGRTMNNEAELKLASTVIE